MPWRQSYVCNCPPGEPHTTTPPAQQSLQTHQGTNLLGHFSAHSKCQLQLQLLFSTRLWPGLLQFRGHPRGGGCRRKTKSSHAAKLSLSCQQFHGQTISHFHLKPMWPSKSPMIPAEDRNWLDIVKLKSSGLQTWLHNYTSQRDNQEKMPSGMQVLSRSQTS
jgi:hypothetical protein